MLPYIVGAHYKIWRLTWIASLFSVPHQHQVFKEPNPDAHANVCTAVVDFPFCSYFFLPASLQNININISMLPPINIFLNPINKIKKIDTTNQISHLCVKETESKGLRNKNSKKWNCKRQKHKGRERERDYQLLDKR